jgi:hypothetical protein
MVRILLSKRNKIYIDKLLCHLLIIFKYKFQMGLKIDIAIYVIKYLIMSTFKLNYFVNYSDKSMSLDIRTCTCIISCANANNPHYHSMYLRLIFTIRFNILPSASYLVPFFSFLGLALILLTSCGRSVCIVRLRTTGHGVFSFWGRVRLSPLGTLTTNWPIVPATGDRWWWWLLNCQGKPKYSEKTCTSVTLSTTNPTWRDMGSNRGCRIGKPATNRLSYGTAFCILSSYSLEHTPNLKFGESPLGDTPWLYTQHRSPFIPTQLQMRQLRDEMNTLRAQLDSKRRIDPRSIKDQTCSYRNFCCILLCCNNIRKINIQSSKVLSQTSFYFFQNKEHGLKNSTLLIYNIFLVKRQVLF